MPSIYLTFLQQANYDMKNLIKSALNCCKSTYYNTRTNDQNWIANVRVACISTFIFDTGVAILSILKNI